MKIVHIEDFIHPDAGYQVNLLSRLQTQDGHEVTVVTAELEKMPMFLTHFFGKEQIERKDQRFFAETGVRIIRVPLLGYYSGRAVFHPRIFKVVDDLNPDVAFVHGEDTLTGMRFIWRSSSLRYPMVLDCHMLEMASHNRLRHVFRFFYKHIFTPIILRNNIPLIRVVDSNFVEKCLGIPLSHTVLLSFGTDTNHFKPNPNARDWLCASHGLDRNAFIVIYAGKLDAFKGAQFLADALKEPITLESGREVQFLIIGNADGDYGRTVERTLSLSKNKIVRLPTQRYFDLAQFYQGVDLAVYPAQCSVSFFEAQSCGLPVLLENNEVNAPRVTHGNGAHFKAGDAEDFRFKLAKLASTSSDEYEKLRAAARKYIVENFDYVPIARQFTEVLQKAIDARTAKSSSRILGKDRRKQVDAT